MISFESEITRKLLSFFFVNEDETLYVNELAETLGVDKRNMMKKLGELEKEGLFISEARGNQKYYAINPDYPLYSEYKVIFQKTLGLQKKLKEIIQDTDHVKRAFIYGSYARDAMNPSSDIDMIVIGEHSSIEIQKKIIKFQKFLGREINITSMSVKEFDRRRNTDPFIKRILSEPLIELI